LKESHFECFLCLQEEGCYESFTVL
jgi:hypothetical protein